ncbi:tetratricopeptide repeat protein [Polluticoccus soli]|uniref:tetratricopeptide repeat protein n=1 Tax=Polluticoccus soli TaxID=3034150 RepID=UPI0023E15C50|nr:hypothetical protein [Flavipsychrobacter sp. JY13-12]
MAVFFLLLLSVPGLAQYEYDYDTDCRKAYTYFLSLQLSDGNQAVIQAIKANPRNLMATYIADYEDCMLLLFNGDRAQLDQRKSHLDARLDLLENGDRTSPWYRFTKAGVYLHWALIYTRFADNLKAANAFRRSFALLKENKKLYPTFGYNDVFIGLEEAVISTLPGDFRWLAAIFGMKGDLKRGMLRLETFLRMHDQEDILYRETALYYNYLRFYLMFQQQEVWSYIASDRFSTDNNLMHLFFRAHIALNFRKADVAVATLQKAKLQKDYNSFPILDYEMASAYLLSFQPATIDYYQRYLSRSRNRMFIKETWMKMAYYYYISGDITKADRCRQQILNSGSLLVDGDKQAQRFAEAAEWPNRQLLQARLLTDGGYYNKAYQKITSLKAEDLRTEVEKVEYYFRLGRIYDELQDPEKALVFYARAAESGKSRKEHYAARAVLQMGFIYEKKGDKVTAMSKFNECLEMRGHDFQNSIDQQAKAGLNRLAN